MRHTHAMPERARGSSGPRLSRRLHAGATHPARARRCQRQQPIAGKCHVRECTMTADDVYAWILRQPAWQRDLARRLSSRVDLDDEDYVEALRVVKAQHGVQVVGGAPAPQPMTRAELPQPTMGEPTKLLRFGNLRGVGLVDQDQALQFEPSGLTVIYGQNGAGKSSYVRALKALSRTVDRDCRVRASIFESEPCVDSSALVRRSPCRGSPLAAPRWMEPRGCEWRA